MRLEFVWNLNGEEVLSRPVYNIEGIVLLESGVRLNKSYINRLKQNNTHYVYIMDDVLWDIKFDSKLNEYKHTILKQMPNIFKGLLESNEQSIKDIYEIVDNIIGIIIDEGDINTILFQMNQYDNYTYIHCIDTCIMATYLGMELGLNKSDLRKLAISSILHDLGKIKIPEYIINKEDKLDSEEMELIKKHPYLGYRILKESGIDDINILLSVLQHHERIDGSGYPLGLKGDKMILNSKIIGICDVYTAISSKRSYRDKFNPNEAYEYIIGASNVLFDSNIVEIFRKFFCIYPLGCKVRLSNSFEGYVIKQNKGFPDKPVVRVIYDYVIGEKVLPYEIDLMEALNVVVIGVV